MIENVLNGNSVYCFEIGDSANVLKRIPDNSIDCIITSPPYWQQRIYEDYNGELSNVIGMEASPDEYVENLTGSKKSVKTIRSILAQYWR